MRKRLHQKTDGFEMRLYERLGILSFQKLMFLLERVRHGRDGRRNENYHLSRSTVGAAEAFVGYLRYNAFLHVVSLLLFAVGLALKYSAYPAWSPLELPIYLMCVLNIWCILLQRYNYLRIQKVCTRDMRLREQRIAAQTAKLLACTPGGYEPEQMREDLRLTERILKETAKGKQMLLTERDADALMRMAVLLEQAGLAPKPDTKGSTVDLDRPVDQLLAESISTGQICSRLEQRVKRLEKWLSVEKQKPGAVMTDDAQTERAFVRLFGSNAPERNRERLLVLRDYLLSVLDGEGK